MNVDSRGHKCPSCNVLLAASSSEVECQSCHVQFRRDHDGNIVGFRAAGAAEAVSAGISFVRHVAAAVLVVTSVVLLLIALVLSIAPIAIAGIVCMATAVGIWSVRGPWSAVVGTILAAVAIAVLVGIYALIGAAISSK